MIRAEACQFGKNLYMYPGERAADTLKQTELPLSFNDRVKTKDVMRSSVPANGESGLKTSDALKEEEYIRYLESLFPGRRISVADHRKPPCDFGNRVYHNRKNHNHTGFYHTRYSSSSQNRIKQHKSRHSH